MKIGLRQSFGSLLLIAAIGGLGMYATPAIAAGTTAAAPGNAAGAPATSAMMARVEQRVASLHTQLQITAAEERQWQQFADVMRQNAQRMDQSAAGRAERLASLNAVDNLKSYADLAEEHAQNAQKLAAAFAPLYDVMAPEQKKIADDIFRGHAERRMKHRER